MCKPGNLLYFSHIFLPSLNKHEALPYMNTLGLQMAIEYSHMLRMFGCTFHKILLMYAAKKYNLRTNDNERVALGMVPLRQ
jgi:hypothetical protein